MELRYIVARLLQMDLKRTSPGLSVAQGLRMGQLPGIKSLGQLPGIKSLISGRFLPSRNTLPMLQAVKSGVFVAVDASCILPCLLVSYGR